MSALERVREKLIVALAGILVGFAVYAALGFAWSFKMAVETPQRLWHHHR
jgi:ABC-type antimicrobial peptide transport system permease subunit